MGSVGVGAVTATGKEIKAEISTKKCGHCYDKPCHVVLRPLEPFCDNVEEFGTVHQEIH